MILDESTIVDIGANNRINEAEKNIILLAKEISLKVLEGDLTVLEKEIEFEEYFELFREYGITRDLLTKRFSAVLKSVLELKNVLSEKGLGFSCIDAFIYEYSSNFLEELINLSDRVGINGLTSKDVILMDTLAYNRLADIRCEFIDPIVLKLLDEILKSASLRIFDSESLRYISENVSMAILQEEKLLSEEEKKFEIFLTYIESLSDFGKNKNDFREQLICCESSVLNDFLQLVRLNKIPEKYQDWARYIVEYKLGMKFIKDPDMSKYDEFVEGQISIPKTMKKEFLHDVSILGFKNGVIPLKYTEYIISQMLDRNSCLYRMTANQRASIFSSFARERSKTIFGREIFVLYTDNMSKKADGTYLNGVVSIAWKHIKNGGLGKIVDNLITLFHELRHVKQEADKAQGKINHRKYMMIKEDVLQELDPNYYDVNYKRVYEEIDARVSAAKEAYHFLTTLPLSKDVKEREVYIQIVEHLKKIMETERNFYVRALSKKYLGEEVADIETLFDQIIKENPDKLERYPILQVEYDENGDRKNIVQIFKELCVVIKRKENRVDTYDLYKYVLFSRLYFEKDIVSELESVELPEDLSEGMKRVIIKLRAALLEKHKELLKKKEKRVVPGRKIKSDKISSSDFVQITKSEEPISDGESEFIDGIMGHNEVKPNETYERE